MTDLDQKHPSCPFFEYIRGEIIHSTGVAEFASIVNDGFVRRGLNTNPMGFCQAEEGLGEYLGSCLSLSDLSISSEDELFDENNNWLDQVFKPWGGAHYAHVWFFKEYARVYVTMIFNREKLDSSKIYTPERIRKDFPDRVDYSGDLVGGNFIYETEIAYAADIPTSAIKSILLVCDRSRKCYRVFDWHLESAKRFANYVLRLEKRLKKVFPPKIHMGPIPPGAL